MKRILLSLSIVFLSVFASGQGLEDIIVEKYYISDANDATDTDGGTLVAGSVTYRIFVDLAPGWILQSVYASPDYSHELRIETTTQFFNNADRGATTANQIANSRLPNNTVMLDSWLAIGGAAAQKMGILKTEDTDAPIINADGFLKNTDPLAGVPIKIQDGLFPLTPPSLFMAGLDQAITVFEDYNAGPLFRITDGSWGSSPGVSGPTPANRVLIAQITTTGVLTFKINLQIRRESDFKVENWVHSNPVNIPNIISEILCEKCTFNGVITSINDEIFNTSSIAKPEISVFPNPAQNVLNIEFINGIRDGVFNYTILNILGNTLLQYEGRDLPERFIRDIDISSLPKGIYLIRIESAGLVSVGRFIKEQ
jgi:hypothetical protein